MKCKINIKAIWGIDKSFVEILIPHLNSAEIQEEIPVPSQSFSELMIQHLKFSYNFGPMKPWPTKANFGFQSTKALLDTVNGF